MPFRDDREALRAQRDALQQERDRLERELEAATGALSSHESKDVIDERELARLKKEVDRLRGRLEPDSAGGQQHRVALIGIGAALLVIVVGVAFALTLPGSDDPPIDGQAPGALAEPATPAVPEPAPEPGPSPLDVAFFGVVVLSAEGVDLAPGEGCVLSAAVEAGPELGDIRLHCRGLGYDPAMSGGAEMTAVDSAVAERSVGPDQHVYRVRYSDVGMRSGPRPQIVVDTARHELRLFRAREASDPFEVELYVESESLPRLGAALGTGEPAPEPEPSEPNAEREVALARASEGTGCDLAGGWVGHLRTKEGAGDGLALRPTSSTTTVTVRNGRTVQRARHQGPQALTVPGSGMEDVTIELDCEGGSGALITADGGRYVGHLGPGNATFLGHNTVDPEWPVLFWLRRETDAETSVDVPGVRIDVNELSPETRRAIDQAIRKAL